MNNLWKRLLASSTHREHLDLLNIFPLAIHFLLRNNARNTSYSWPDRFFNRYFGYCYHCVFRNIHYCRSILQLPVWFPSLSLRSKTLKQERHSGTDDLEREANRGWRGSRESPWSGRSCQTSGESLNVNLRSFSNGPLLEPSRSFQSPGFGMPVEYSFYTNQSRVLVWPQGNPKAAEVSLYFFRGDKTELRISQGSGVIGLTKPPTGGLVA